MGSLKNYSVYIVLLVFLSFGMRASAQQEIVNYSSPREYQIADITVSGVEFLDNAALIHLSGLVVGQRLMIPGDKISDAVDKLWKQGMFENITITITKIEGNRVYLNIGLEERPRLSYITFEGLKKGEISKIEDELDIKDGDIITDYKISTIEKKVKKVLLDKSYLNAEIHIIRKVDTTTNNSIQLIVNVDKKDKVKISNITISGNTAKAVKNSNATFWQKCIQPFAKIGNPEDLAFPDKKIRHILKNTKQVNFWRFWKKSKYIPSAFKEDLATLITDFNKEGYRDARVVSDSVYKINDKRIGIKINLFEGKPYYFGDIRFVGNKKYTDLQLKEVLGIKKGEIYNEEKFTKNLMSNPSGVDVYALYYDDGYLMFSATPVETNVYNDTVDMEIRIYEGRQSRFNEISLKGNTRTNDHVILRETRTVPGQLFSRSDLINSVNELRQLRFFNDQTINPDVQPNEDGSVNIQYQVEEVGSDQLELSGGWGGGMIVGTVGIAFNNFSLQNIFKKDRWKPLPSGDGQKLSLRVQSNGTYYYTISGSFTEPWLGGKKPLALSVSANHSMQANRYSKGDSRYGRLIINGVSVGLGQRLTWPDDFFTLYQSFNYQQYRMTNYTDVIEGFENGTSNNFNYAITLSRQSMDAALFPKTGSSLSVTVQLTPPYSLFGNKNYKGMSMEEKFNWLEYYKVSVKMGWYFNPFANLVVNARIRFGFLGYYNSEIGYPPFERFFLGGDGLTGFALDGRELIGLRGYLNNSLSPSYGSTAYEKITLELRYPISNNPVATIYALGFFEAGNAWDVASKVNPFSLYKSAGVGVRLYLAAMGMFGLDWGYGFDAVPGNPKANKSQFHFSINQSLDW